VWEFVSVGLPSVPLPSGVRPRELEDVACSVLRFAIGSTRATVLDIAKQVLTVALDVFICAGRDVEERSRVAAERRSGRHWFTRGEGQYHRH
jgi:translation initiation factor 2 gamma subunit (eIF-2gamma)